MKKKTKRRKGLPRPVGIIIIIVLIALLGRISFSFSYAVFYQQAMTTEARSSEVEITVQEGMSVYQIGRLLESKGLIENALIFTVQEQLSDYRGQIKTGRHTLNTAQKPDEILEELSKEASS